MNRALELNIPNACIKYLYNRKCKKVTETYNITNTIEKIKCYVSYENGEKKKLKKLHY